VHRPTARAVASHGAAVREGVERDWEAAAEEHGRSEQRQRMQTTWTKRRAVQCLQYPVTEQAQVGRPQVLQLLVWVLVAAWGCDALPPQYHPLQASTAAPELVVDAVVVAAAVEAV
jgi:hypothetical protein